MEFKSCGLAARFALNINGRIDTEKNVVALCCENVPNVPAIPFTGTASEILDKFIGMRTAMIAESIHRPEGTHFGCRACANYCNNDWSLQLFITYVNLSMYPAPCQCRCCYCDVQRWIDTPEVHESYEKLFELLELAKERCIIDPHAVYQVSTGEISIHPYRKRIMDLVKGRCAAFYTNAFIFDEDIAQNLHDNPASQINLSIDAGTPKTWKKVKGFDNFEEICSNLALYRKNSARPGQITLKYIVLPDVNDNYEDYVSVMEIAKVLEVKHLTISRDTRKKYTAGGNERNKLLGAAAYLLAISHSNEIENDMFTYTPEEQKEIIALANEVLKKKLI